MAAFWIALLLLGVVALCRADILVNTSLGTVKGVQTPKGQSFLGLPFARPPIGDLRWQPPLPPHSWVGVREANLFGADCAAGSSDYVHYKKSEDCLYLNVYRPSNATPDSRLPVMHFLYGGSWEWGGSSFFIYNGENIVQYANVIVVTSNYRLGPFGFLGSSQLAALTGDKSTGNYGLQDQRAAMVWIQDNIEAFGGDINRVMLFGESAGAGSTAAHLVSPRSKGLFQYAAMESGPPSDWTAAPLAHSEAVYAQILASAGCNSAACLLSKTTQEILTAATGNISSALVHWSPIIDGVEFDTEPQLLWKAGKINNVFAILLGTNLDEGTEFTKVSHNITAAEYSAWLQTRYGPSLGATVEQLYPAANFSKPWFAASMVFTDSLMACPSRRAARWASSSNITTFLYQFIHQLEALKAYDPYLGVMHASELPLVFDAAEVLWTPAERQLSKYFIDYWTSFATTGNPNADVSGARAPTWPTFTTSSDAYLVLDLVPTAAAHLKTSVCDFWDTIFDKGCNMASCPCPCA